MERVQPQAGEQRQTAEQFPVYVLGVSEQPLYGDELTALQENLVTISSNTTRSVIQGATHETLVSKREYAAQVSQAIRHVIHAAQTGTMLSDHSLGGSDNDD